MEHLSSERRRFTRPPMNGDTLQQDLALAGRSQRSLLPPFRQSLQGFELAGRCTTCTEVGGDYFDYLFGSDFIEDSLKVIIGDVSGHGVDAALLMSAARTFLRIRSTLPGKPAEIVSALNRQFAADIAGTGHFMTLFYIDFDLETGESCWVRAGHDPAVIFDPLHDDFLELRGSGLPLGVDHSYRYQGYHLSNMVSGSIIIMATDGIWEARNFNGEFFGKRLLREIVRESAGKSAHDIVGAVFDALESFCRGVPIHDDMTLVIVKVK